MHSSKTILRNTDFYFWKSGSITVPKNKYHRIVIIGGGFAGLALLKELKNKNVSVILIDQNNYHQFQPLLYQVATSGLEPDNIAFPFRKQIASYKNVRFRLAEVKSIDPAQNLIKTNKGNLNYDYLVIATGTKTNYFNLKNLKDHSLGMKSIRDSLDIRHKMLQNLEQATITCDKKEREALTNFVIVGGGPAGVEMAGALAEFCKYILPKDYPEYPSSLMKIYLIEASDRLLGVMSEKASAKAYEYLTEQHVEILLKEVVSNYDGILVKTKSGKKVTAKNLIWTAGVTGNLPKGIDENSIVRGNRLKTDEFLRVKGTKNIYAIGDISAIITKEYPRGHPQVAQTAIQQGKYLAGTILNHINNKPSTPFCYRDKGALATIGKRKAVADLGKISFTGYTAWLLWSFVHLMSISGVRNKLIVGLNWAISYFSYEKSNRLIIRNFKENELT